MLLVRGARGTDPNGKRTVPAKSSEAPMAHCSRWMERQRSRNGLMYKATWVDKKLHDFGCLLRITTVWS